MSDIGGQPWWRCRVRQRVRHTRGVAGSVEGAGEDAEVVVGVVAEPGTRINRADAR